MATDPLRLSIERIQRSIIEVRGHRVMLDADLAAIYGVTARRLNEQVRRNIDRFPGDFSFLLTAGEVADLKSQFATSSSGWGGKRKLPRVFTEHGAVMAANVLNSPVAVSAGIQVVRAFLHFRTMLVTHAEFTRRLDDLEAKYVRHDKQLAAVFEAIRQLMEPPPTPPKRGRLGFR